MNLAVVIPAYEKVAEVLHCLNSLRALAANPTAIRWHVQDDCSPSVNFPICIPREVASTSRNESNLGFAANANAGAWEALAQYQPDVLFFINQDVYAVSEWSQGWDAALLAAFDDPAVGVVAPRLLFPNGSIQSVGGTYDQLCQPVHKCLGWTNPHHRDCATPCELEWTTGAAYGIRTSLFMQLGGFDERYERGYFEDCDLSLRVHEAGYKIMFEPRCTLIHSVGSTGGSPNFMQNARQFKARWVDSGRVKAGRLMPTFRYW